jgi:hypothetical protein
VLLPSREDSSFHEEYASAQRCISGAGRMKPYGWAPPPSGGINKHLRGWAPQGSFNDVESTPGGVHPGESDGADGTLRGSPRKCLFIYLSRVNVYLFILSSMASMPRPISENFHSKL